MKRAAAATVAALTALTLGAAFSGENENVEFTLISPTAFTQVGPGDTLEVSLFASGIVEAKQVEIVIEVSPPAAFDLDGSHYDPSTSLFSLGLGLDRPGGGQMRGGGASVLLPVSGDGSLGTFYLVTSPEFDNQTEASITVLFISIGPSFAVRDEFDQEALALSIAVNSGAVVAGEPLLRATTTADVAADPSPAGSGNVLDGSRGEVTFQVQFFDSSGAAAAGQPISWSISNEGGDSVLLLDDGPTEIASNSAMTLITTSDSDGAASITLDAEGGPAAVPTTTAVIASTSAPNSLGEPRELTVEFSVTWDVAVPSELSTFTGEHTSADQILLRWGTASQSGNLGWEVFRSVDGAETFDSVGQIVPGAGTVDDYLTYEFLDDQVPSAAEVISYYLRQTNLDGSSSRSGILDVPIVPSGPEKLALPVEYRLAQNYPNPFNPSTVIEFDLVSETPVELTVYDVAGRKVRLLIDSPAMRPGRYRSHWDGRDDAARPVGNGVYFYGLECSGFRSAGRMVLVR